VGDGVTAGLHPPDLEHVPTVAELVRQGMARAVTVKYFDAAGKPKSDTRYTVTAKGQQLIDDAMTRNAERGRAWDARRTLAAVDADLV
jgi:hypothetical protein